MAPEKKVSKIQDSLHNLFLLFVLMQAAGFLVCSLANATLGIYYLLSLVPLNVIVKVILDRFDRRQTSPTFWLRLLIVGSPLLAILAIALVTRR